jgi:hypothetical protein
MSSTRAGLLALAAGLLHASGLVAVALHLGYSIGPAEYSLLGVTWRYGGLVIVAAVPVWLAIRYRIVLPLIGLLLTTGYVLGLELTPPGPTFRDVAELERLDESTGIMVIENGLYIVRYMVNASVWTVGFLFLAALEYTVRSTRTWLPAPRNEVLWLSMPLPRRRAALFAASGGLLHAFVMVWYAVRLGVTVTSGFAWVLYPLSAVGMWLLAAVPLYLLVRQLLVLPATLLSGFILLDVFSGFTAAVDDPHALYFGAWFLFLGILLVVALIEYGGRQIGILTNLRSIV